MLHVCSRHGHRRRESACSGNINRYESPVPPSRRCNKSEKLSRGYFVSPVRLQNYQWHCDSPERCSRHGHGFYDSPERRSRHRHGLYDSPERRSRHRHEFHKSPELRSRHKLRDCDSRHRRSPESLLERPRSSVGRSSGFHYWYKTPESSRERVPRIEAENVPASPTCICHKRRVEKSSIKFVNKLLRDCRKAHDEHSISDRPKYNVKSLPKPNLSSKYSEEPIYDDATKITRRSNVKRPSRKRKGVVEISVPPLSGQDSPKRKKVKRAYDMSCAPMTYAKKRKEPRSSVDKGAKTEIEVELETTRRAATEELNLGKKSGKTDISFVSKNTERNGKRVHKYGQVAAVKKRTVGSGTYRNSTFTKLTYKKLRHSCIKVNRCQASCIRSVYVKSTAALVVDEDAGDMPEVIETENARDVADMPMMENSEQSLEKLEDCESLQSASPDELCHRIEIANDYSFPVESLEERRCSAAPFDGNLQFGSRVGEGWEIYPDSEATSKCMVNLARRNSRIDLHEIDECLEYLERIKRENFIGPSVDFFLNTGCESFTIGDQLASRSRNHLIQEGDNKKAETSNSVVLEENAEIATVMASKNSENNTDDVSSCPSSQNLDIVPEITVEMLKILLKNAKDIEEQLLSTSLYFSNSACTSSEDACSNRQDNDFATSVSAEKPIVHGNLNQLEFPEITVEMLKMIIEDQLLSSSTSLCFSNSTCTSSEDACSNRQDNDFATSVSAEEPIIHGNLNQLEFSTGNNARSTSTATKPNISISPMLPTENLQEATIDSTQPFGDSPWKLTDVDTSISFEEVSISDPCLPGVNNSAIAVVNPRPSATYEEEIEIVVVKQEPDPDPTSFTFLKQQSIGSSSDNGWMMTNSRFAEKLKRLALNLPRFPETESSSVNLFPSGILNKRIMENLDVSSSFNSTNILMNETAASEDSKVAANRQNVIENSPTVSECNENQVLIFETPDNSAADGEPTEVHHLQKN